MDISLGIILDRLSEYRIETYLPHPSELKFDRIELFPQRIADLRTGQMTRHLVTKDGFTGVELADPEDIFRFVDGKLQ